MQHKSFWKSSWCHSCRNLVFTKVTGTLVLAYFVYNIRASNFFGGASNFSNLLAAPASGYKSIMTIIMSRLEHVIVVLYQQDYKEQITTNLLGGFDELKVLPPHGAWIIEASSTSKRI